MSFFPDPFRLGQGRCATDVVTPTALAPAFRISWCNDTCCLTSVWKDFVDWHLLPSLLMTADSSIIVRQDGAGTRTVDT